MLVKEMQHKCIPKTILGNNQLFRKRRKYCFEIPGENLMHITG